MMSHTFSVPHMTNDRHSQSLCLRINSKCILRYTSTFTITVFAHKQRVYKSVYDRGTAEARARMHHRITEKLSFPRRPTPYRLLQRDIHEARLIVARRHRIVSARKRTHLETTGLKHMNTTVTFPVETQGFPTDPQHTSVPHAKSIP